MLFIPPLLLAALTLTSKVAYHPPSSNDCKNLLNATNATHHYTKLDPFVRIADEAIDMQLNWTMQSDTFVNGERLPINPSLLFQDDGKGGQLLIRAVRAHALTEDFVEGTFEGETVTEQIMRFDSSIMLKAEPFNGNLGLGFDDESVAQWGLDGLLPLESIDASIISHQRNNETWTNLCESKPAYNKADKWLVRKLVNGPEDPKLLKIPLRGEETTSWGVTFSSFPPASLLASTGTSSDDDCKWVKEAVMQMYLASEGPILASREKSQGVKLNCGDPESTEKNWIAFHNDDKLYFIYTVEPHVVVHVRKTDGACVEQYKTSSPQLQEVAQRAYSVRGSATATLFTESEYLALMHTWDPDHGYDTVAYTFQSRPPFAVQRLSKPLPLHGRAFASSLTVESNKIIIGYGDSDASSRVLVMSRDHMELLFDWCLG